MKLAHDLHLAYCTNIHRGETWAETMAALQQFALAVRDRVCSGRSYAIGLRLSDLASRELIQSENLNRFRRWLDENDCYVFTINGFPYGQFHGTRVKEQVYRPDWTAPDRLHYTKRLFDILAELLPDGMEGSVSTLPGSFKEFITTREQCRAIRDNLFACVEHIEKVSIAKKKALHLGLEPEPLGLFENTNETVEFFLQLREEHPRDDRLKTFLGVNYDTCHFAVEFEDPIESLRAFRENDIKISKLHLSSALKLVPAADSLAALKGFGDNVYLHQVVTRDQDGVLTRYKDLDVAPAVDKTSAREWRVHFHIPLHSQPTAVFDTTTDHLLGVLDVLQANPAMCSHLEMETYTWEVMPPELKGRSVVEQLASEYAWCLEALRRRGLAGQP